ncbi:hypothetical protein Patl1_34276 [Pistacia atlantica]|uniref:Uncharacterized protein n=1 Tax=Pistacia atlantica TaxID=434234 RepID=A0ACC0ZRM4_9ROSI|nr:hypothetical protein Patl1_34276 [Pistacia atlantica]
MLKFRLFISILHVKESAPYIDKWVELATEKEVKEFDLKFLDDGDYKLALEFDLYNSPRVIDIVGGSKLKKLKFVGTDLKEQDFHHFISKFPLLEDLTLLTVICLKELRFQVIKLKKFQVNNCFNMKAIDLIQPNLLSFTYENSSIPTLLINALCPWQVQCYPNLTFNTQWCLVLREFLGVSHQIETLSLYVRKSVSFYNEWKNRDVSCCNSHEIKCWRHFLKDIKVEGFEYPKDRKLVGANKIDEYISLGN